MNNRYLCTKKMLTMKKTLLTTFLLMLITAISAQNYSPERTAGIYYAYPVTDTSTLTPLPSTLHLQPFYISHYGRHGSRWLPDEQRYEWVNAQFENEANLTPFGKTVKKKLK